MKYLEQIEEVRRGLLTRGTEWRAINPEYVVRMRLQNRFKTGVDIAKYTAQIMRKDMAEYDADPANYTQSLGAWHGFVAQQSMMSAKKKARYRRQTIYLSQRLDGRWFAL